MIAFVRGVGADTDRGDKSLAQRRPVNAKSLRKQHGRVASFLKEAGVVVEYLPALAEGETSLLVGDVALLLPEIAIIARPNDAGRLRELDSILGTLGQHRPVQSIVDPGTLDAADVLRIGRTVYVSESPRTNADGVTQLRDIVASHGYSLRILSGLSAGSLRSACSFIPPHFLLLDPARIEAAEFENVIAIAVDETEPTGAMTLSVGGTTLVSASAPKTEKKLSDAGVATGRLDISEFEKMDAGLSSLVLLLEPRTANHSASETGLIPVQATGVPLVDGHASQAVVHGGFVFTSPVFPFDPTTTQAKRVSVEAQTETMIRNLATVLSASGSSLGRVVRTTVYVADPKHVPRIDAVWPQLFGNHRPARAIVANGALPAGVLVGIEAVAAQGERSH
jgi:dimethylargininase